MQSIHLRIPNEHHGGEPFIPVADCVLFSAVPIARLIMMPENLLAGFGLFIEKGYSSGENAPSLIRNGLSWRVGIGVRIPML